MTSKPIKFVKGQSSDSEEGNNEEIVDDNEEIERNEMSYIPSKVQKMMGYELEKCTWKDKYGIREVWGNKPKTNSTGLGYIPKDPVEEWDSSQEEIVIEEKVEWFECSYNECFKCQQEWIKQDRDLTSMTDQYHFCDKQMLEDILRGKDFFDDLDIRVLYEARKRANPFEEIRSVFFINRAALKMANIDAATDFIFTDIDKQEPFGNSKGPFYFADVCAGPGGFTEYILFRKGWFFKGFGLTLREENDFNFDHSKCASAATFQALYGVEGDGDICKPENIADFKTKVLKETDDLGVHFIMADGGFSVEGKENLQEVLSKNIYICQCFTALEVLRPHGHFVTKLFDLFTEFSVGMIFLMRQCFEQISILKPNASRPANSERYFICKGYRGRGNGTVDSVRGHFDQIIRTLWKLREKDLSILSLVPFEVIKADEDFFNFIVNSNNSLGKRQLVGLRKLATFYENRDLEDGYDQRLLKKLCLAYWKLDEKRPRNWKKEPLDNLLEIVKDSMGDLMFHFPAMEIDYLEKLDDAVESVNDWHFCPLVSSREKNMCYIFAVTDKVYSLEGFKWCLETLHMALVPGSIFYAEKVVEKCSSGNVRVTIQVIDALILGGLNLSDKSFTERRELIEIFCKAANRESAVIEDAERIRPKPILPLKQMESGLRKQDDMYFCDLPIVSLDGLVYRFRVNSLFLFRTDESFLSTWLWKKQVFDEGDCPFDLVKKLICELD